MRPSPCAHAHLVEAVEGGGAGMAATQGHGWGGIGPCMWARVWAWENGALGKPPSPWGLGQGSTAPPSTIPHSRQAQGADPARSGPRGPRSPAPAPEALAQALDEASPAPGPGSPELEEPIAPLAMRPAHAKAVSHASGSSRARIMRARARAFLGRTGTGGWKRHPSASLSHRRGRNRIMASWSPP